MSFSFPPPPDIMPTLQEALEMAVAHHQAGRLEQAERLYRAILDVVPDHADTLHLLGVLMRRRGYHEEAVRLIQSAIALDSGQPSYHNNLGIALSEQGQFPAAEAAYRAALALQPGFPGATTNLANCLRSQGLLDQSVTLYEAALAQDPDLAEAWIGLGNARRDQGRPSEAKACYARALALRPDSPEALNNLGVILKNLDDLEQAEACFRRALELRPSAPDTLCNLAATLREQGHRDAALACYDQALGQVPDDAAALWARTMTLIPALQEATTDLDTVRQEFATALDELAARATSAPAVAWADAVGTEQPFYLAYQDRDNRDLLSRHGRLCCHLMEQWQQKRGLFPTAKQPTDRLRIGIVSAHIQDHSVWQALIKGWLRHVDKTRFEIHVFSLGLVSDAETELAGTLAHALVRGPRTLEDWARTLLASHPDVLIYPEVGMDPLTLKLAAMRLAPIQVAAWGHPDTTGLPSMDLYLSGQAFEPERGAEHYSETLIPLPGLGCAYGPLQVEPERPPDLPADALEKRLLLCPGTPFKYAPVHDPVWVKIAQGLDDCRLVFFQHRRRALSNALRERLDHAFSQAGMDMSQHVLFLPWQSRSGFYWLLDHATAYLDSPGFSGFNSAMQAIERGVPLVTLESGFMRGRLAGGILRQMGLASWIPRTSEEYIHLARTLATDHDRHAAMVRDITQRRHALFDDPAPVRALETLLAERSASLRNTTFST